MTKNDVTRTGELAVPPSPQPAAAHEKAATHTPGPLYIVRRGYDGYDIQTAPEPQLCEIVATAWGGGRMWQHCDANARLIAAAPDLLAVLERSLNWLASYPGNGAANVYEQASAAIAKAEGRHLATSGNPPQPPTGDR